MVISQMTMKLHKKVNLVKTNVATDKLIDCH